MSSAGAQSLPEADTYLNRYIRRANGVTPLSREQEARLIERYQATGDRAAKDAILAAHLRSVVAIALKYRRYRVPIDELIAEGNLGVVYALSKFDARRGTRFVTYASYWVRAHVLNQVIRSWSLVGVGSAALRSKMFFRIRRERARILNVMADGQEADALLARALNLPVAKVSSMVRRLEARDVSLATEVHDGSTTTLLDTLVDRAPSQELRLGEREGQEYLRAALESALASLDERERFIVERRLMAHDEDELSLSEIGRRLGISRERARQLEARAKSKLKGRLEQLSQRQGDWLSAMVAA